MCSYFVPTFCCAYLKIIHNQELNVLIKQDLANSLIVFVGL